MSTAEEIVRSEHDAVVARACTGKTPYGRALAHKVAEETRARGVNVSCYRCPFCHSYHLGHVMSIEGMETMARVIRGLPPVPKEAGQA